MVSKGFERIDGSFETIKKSYQFIYWIVHIIICTYCINIIIMEFDMYG